jgi:uncharacterized metal-binding protein YceD (DUF177 family)
MLKRFINLEEISSDSPLKIKTKVPAKFVNLPEEEGKAVSDFDLELTIFKAGSGYDIVGRYQGKIKVICARCGNEFEKHIKSEFHYSLMPLSTAGKGGDISNEDMDVKFSDEKILDLHEVLREQILLNLPSKMLCPECPEDKGFVSYIEEDL